MTAEMIWLFFSLGLLSLLVVGFALPKVSFVRWLLLAAGIIGYGIMQYMIGVSGGW